MNQNSLLEKQNEIINLAIELIKIPAVSVGCFTNVKAIHQCFEFIVDYLKSKGLRVIEFKENNGIPGLYCDLGYTNFLSGNILFVGHYDRVSPSSEKQFEPVIKGDWLKARGATDMLCTVATLMVLLKDLKLEDRKYNCGLLMVGNEESGETGIWGTPHILSALKSKYGFKPEFTIVGERTGEGEMNIGRIEIKNRGLVRIKIKASGSPLHTAQLKEATVIERIIELQNRVFKLFSKTQNVEWCTTFTIPYFISGEEGNFNTTPVSGIAGLEIRPIPEEDFLNTILKIEEIAKALSLEIEYVNKEPGIITRIDNPFIQKLLSAIIKINGGNPREYLGIGKPHATQARFIESPVVIFGQSGIGPHSEKEAHYIPSIIPYYFTIREFLKNLDSLE